MMKVRMMIAGWVVACTAVTSVSACGVYMGDLVEGDDADRMANAIQVRGYGPFAMPLIQRRLAPEIKAYQALLAAGQVPAATSRVARAVAALDVIAGQRDAWASGLYWYKDIKSARQMAGSQRPVLSLRMLGDLTEEYSCANSRYFRTILYADPAISAYLRENYILHWQSVRPVPRITIDFGDGRKLDRTITGNSLHHVLDGKGRVIDTLPGLHAPHAFLAWLKETRQHFDAMNKVSQEGWTEHYLQLHADARARIARDWVRARPVTALAVNTVRLKILPDAYIAALRADSKSGGEVPMLKAFLPEQEAPGKTEDEAVWAMHAAPVQQKIVFSSETLLIMRRDHHVMGAGKDDAFDTMLTRFKESLALDTAKNRFRLHHRIHEWLGDASVDVNSLNAWTDRIYAELFLTPKDDPWLGMLPADAFVGLEGGGVLVD